VGTGGHTLYGGFGFLSRFRGGLLVDTVQSAKVVLANGTLVTASAQSYPDLFFALRGGGPSFGLVVEWTYLTSAAPLTTINYGINFPSSLSITQATAAYAAWQAFATSAPDALAMAAVLGAAGSGSVSLSFEGNYYGTLSEAQSVLGPLVASVGNGATLTTKSLGWIQGLEAFAGNGGSLNTMAPDAVSGFSVLWCSCAEKIFTRAHTA
jgi:FAD/FMN-containing dehydrogenase